MSHPRVHIRDETMREGMQVESADISVEDKIELIDRLSETGLKNLVVGFFASPRYTPQMKDVDAVISGFTPVEGVRYTAGAPNAKGRERRDKHIPPLSKAPPSESRPTLAVRISDTFQRRNTNSTTAAQLAAWPGIVERAKAAGVPEAGMSISCAWGSNFEGPFSEEERMEVFERAHAMWDEAGIPVTAVGLSDAESWGMPHLVERQVTLLLERWPDLRHFFFHIHNGRGTAMAQAYAILRLLDDSHDVYFDTTCGGIGGCPYCGNGRATGMIPTEDLVVMLEEMGIPTGVDIEKLVRFVWRLEEVLGRSLMGHVSKVGWLPRGAEELYDPNLPFVETFAQARHFLEGPAAAAEGLVPWREPIPPPARPYGGRMPGSHADPPAHPPA